MTAGIADKTGQSQLIKANEAGANETPGRFAPASPIISPDRVYSWFINWLSGIAQGLISSTMNPQL